MKIDLAYGKDGLVVDVPDANLAKVLSVENKKIIKQPRIEIIKGLLLPLGVDKSLFDLAKRRKSACILICEKAHRTHNKILLPPILKTLNAAGLKKEEIVILIASAGDCSDSNVEISQLVGDDIAKNYRIEKHDAHDNKAHRYLGETARGTSVFLHKRFLDSDLKIVTGFIEPHMLNGFSSGCKLIAPGIVDVNTLKQIAALDMLESAQVSMRSFENNVFHQESLEIARMSGVDFIVNVTLNGNSDITGVFSGRAELAHLEGLNFVMQTAKATLPEPADIVITTGGGYPHDRNWCQALKGLSAVLPVIKENGSILIAAECRDGIGCNEIEKYMAEFDNIEDIFNNVSEDNHFLLNHISLRDYKEIVKTRKVTFISNRVPENQKNDPKITWADSIQKALISAIEQQGKNASIAVIPNGIHTITSIG